MVESEERKNAQTDGSKWGPSLELNIRTVVVVCIISPPSFHHPFTTRWETASLLCDRVRQIQNMQQQFLPGGESGHSSMIDSSRGQKVASTTTQQTDSQRNKGEEEVALHKDHGRAHASQEGRPWVDDNSLVNETI